MEQLFGAIPKVLGEIAPNASVNSAIVFAAWSRCAGDLLKMRTAPVNFTANRLVIAVEDKTWQRNLEDLSPTMLVKLNMSLGQGTVKFIEFRVNKKAIDAIRESVQNADKTAVAMLKAPLSLVKAANSIASVNLREQFLSTAATYLERQKDRKSLKP